MKKIALLLSLAALLAAGATGWAQNLPWRFRKVEVRDSVAFTAGGNGLNNLRDKIITDGIISATKLASGSVSTAKIQDGAVTAAKIIADAITSSKILDGTIENADLKDSTIGITKIANSLRSYIDASGGGTITNLADEVTITENVGNTLGVKPGTIGYAQLQTVVSNAIQLAQARLDSMGLMLRASCVHYVSPSYAGLAKPYFTVIQTALDSLPPGMPGRVNCYNVTDSTLRTIFTGLGIQEVVYITRSNVYLDGTGTSKIVIPQHAGEVGGSGTQGYGGSGIVIHRQSQYEELTDITVTGFEIDGQGKYQEETGGGNTAPFLARYVKRITVRDMYIHDAMTTGMGLAPVTQGSVENCRIIRGNWFESGGNGINMYSVALDVVSSDSTVRNSSMPLGGQPFDDRGMGNRITGCYISDFDLGIDAAFYGQYGMVIANNQITMCDEAICVEVIGDYGPKTNGYVTIANNTCFSSRLYGDVAIGINGGAWGGMRYTHAINITGNVIRNWRGGGIGAVGSGSGSEVNVSDNIIVVDTTTQWTFGINLANDTAYSYHIVNNIVDINTKYDATYNGGIMSGISIAAYSGITEDVLIADNTVVYRQPADSARHPNQIGIVANDRSAELTCSRNNVRGWYVGVSLGGNTVPTSNMKILDNWISKNYSNGLSSYYLRHALIRGNHIFNNGLDATLTDTWGDSYTRAGFWVGLSLDSCVVSENFFYDNQATHTQSYAARINGGYGTKWLDNYIFGNFKGRFDAGGAAADIPSTYDWEVRDNGKFNMLPTNEPNAPANGVIYWVKAGTTTDTLFVKTKDGVNKQLTP